MPDAALPPLLVTPHFLMMPIYAACLPLPAT